MQKTLSKIIGIVVFVSILLNLTSNTDVWAQEKDALSQKSPVNINLFYGEGCPHCEEEIKYLNEEFGNDPDVKIKTYEVWYNSQNQKLLTSISNNFDVDIDGVPATFIGQNLIFGFGDGATTGAEIKKLVDSCKSEGCVDLVALLIDSELKNDPENSPKNDPTLIPDKNSNTEISLDSISKNINVPFVGLVDVSTLSLPVLSVLLGVLDGFNPCAMWVLLFLISLLVGIQDRKRRWILGLSFIAISGLVYLLFMSAWLNVILFIGVIYWVRIFVGLVALIAGIHHFREFLIYKDDGCKVTGEGTRRTIFEKLKKYVSEKSLILSLIGIGTVAFSVNLIELVCSFGFPLIFTQILAYNNLNTAQYLFYMLLYILFFVIDDLFVFFTAMRTLELTGITTKYVKYSKLIGGVLMIIIGLLLVFKPEILMFSGL